MHCFIHGLDVAASCPRQHMPDPDHPDVQKKRITDRFQRRLMVLAGCRWWRGTTWTTGWMASCWSATAPAPSSSTTGASPVPNSLTVFEVNTTMLSMTSEGVHPCAMTCVFNAFSPRSWCNVATHLLQEGGPRVAEAGGNCRRRCGGDAMRPARSDMIRCTAGLW